MPTYQISTALPIPASKKQQLAEKITEIHARNTGAPKFAVQVLYRGLAPEDHYHGGIKTSDLKHPMIWLLAYCETGHTTLMHSWREIYRICKTGRTPEIKLNMLKECQEAIVSTLGEGVIKEQVMLHVSLISWWLQKPETDHEFRCKRLIIRKERTSPCWTLIVSRWRATCDCLRVMLYIARSKGVTLLTQYIVIHIYT